MRAVNLLPIEAQPRRSFHGSGALVVGGIAATAVIAVALGAGFMSAHSRAASDRQRLADAHALLARLDAAQAAQQPKPEKPEKPVLPIVPVPAVTSELQPRLDALSVALGGRVEWDRLLREFSQVMPSDVTLASLSMDAPSDASSSPSSSSNGSTFSLTGVTFSNDAVARLLSRLALIPDLTDPILKSSTLDPSSGQVQFTIGASLKAPSTPAGAAS